MSLILEALKKSEAERRLGQVPGLMTPVTRATPRRGSRLPQVLGALVVIALLAVGIWWWQRAGEPAALTPDELRRVAAANSTSGAAGETSNTARAPVTPALPAVVRPAPVEQIPTLPAELPSDPDFVSQERESRPVPAQSPPPLEHVVAPPSIPAPPPAAMAGATPAQTTPRIETLPATPPVIETLPPPVAPTQPVASPPATSAPLTSAPAEEPLEYLPRLVDLSAEQRNALPPLKLSMQVFTADPAGRFVIIDGRRLTEGERLSPALTLREVRRDGAVMELDGQRFLLPRP